MLHFGLRSSEQLDVIILLPQPFVALVLFALPQKLAISKSITPRRGAAKLPRA